MNFFAERKARKEKERFQISAMRRVAMEGTATKEDLKLVKSLAAEGNSLAESSLDVAKKKGWYSL